MDYFIHEEEESEMESQMEQVEPLTDDDSEVLEHKSILSILFT